MLCLQHWSDLLHYLSSFLLLELRFINDFQYKICHFFFLPNEICIAIQRRLDMPNKFILKLNRAFQWLIFKFTKCRPAKDNFLVWFHFFILLHTSLHDKFNQVFIERWYMLTLFFFLYSTIDQLFSVYYARLDLQLLWCFFSLGLSWRRIVVLI